MKEETKGFIPIKIRRQGAATATVSHENTLQHFVHTVGGELN
jgi:hypothetical protein